MTDIKTAASIFGEVYRSAKGKNGSEALLKECQQDFFDAVTAHLETTTLAQETVMVDTDLRYHPGWRVINPHFGQFVLIEEDPALKPWGGIIDGYVYRRGVTNKDSTVDVERLQAEDLELWDEISYWPEWDLVHDALLWAYKETNAFDPNVVAEAEADNFLADRPKTLLPSEEWTAKQAAKIQKYVIPGAVSPRLIPPRKAKEHELETGEIDE